jgi:hypothetical protein
VRAARLGIGFGLALGACTASHPSTDRFVAAPGEVGAWATTDDGRVRVPLRRGLTWSKDATDDGTLKMRAEEGPTYLVVATVDRKPDLTLRSCAEAHRIRVLAAANARGVEMTPPRLVDESHRGTSVPRVSYAVPLEAAKGERPASLMSSWTYALDGDRCLAIGVTTIVHASAADPNAPDPEDLQRLEGVYEVAADGVEVGAKSP